MNKLQVISFIENDLKVDVQKKMDFYILYGKTWNLRLTL